MSCPACGGSLEQAPPLTWWPPVLRSCPACLAVIREEGTTRAVEHSGAEIARLVERLERASREGLLASAVAALGEEGVRARLLRAPGVFAVARHAFGTRVRLRQPADVLPPAGQ